MANHERITGSDAEQQLLSALAGLILSAPSMYIERKIFEHKAVFCHSQPLGNLSLKLENGAEHDPLIEEMNLCLLSLNRKVESGGLILKQFMGFDPKVNAWSVELAPPHGRPIHGQPFGIIQKPPAELARTLRFA